MRLELTPETLAFNRYTVVYGIRAIRFETTPGDNLFRNMSSESNRYTLDIYIFQWGKINNECVNCFRLPGDFRGKI